MSNKEKKFHSEHVHLYLAIKRTKDGEKSRCIRSVIKDTGDELVVLRAKLRALGGTWRIHKTINARDVERARRVLLKRLIDFPEKASYVDSEWRTALLQRDCIFGEKRFLLDIDTKEKEKLDEVKEAIENDGGEIVEMMETPGGFHYVVKPFDTRKVVELEDVTLLRDGYIFIEIVSDFSLENAIYRC